MRDLLSAESQTAWSRQKQPILTITHVMKSALVSGLYYSLFGAQWRTVYRIRAQLFYHPNAAEEINTLLIKANFELKLVF